MVRIIYVIAAVSLTFVYYGANGFFKSCVLKYHTSFASYVYEAYNMI